MYDWLPLRAWLLIAVAAVGFVPTSYVVRYLKHAPNRRDITLPPEDLSWRSSKKFSTSLVTLALLGAFAIFIFTPMAVEVAQSPLFVPGLIACCGVWVLWTVARGYVSGKIEPASRGSIGPFSRASQPKRFWASMTWNSLVGCGCLFGAFATAREGRRDFLRTQCYNEDERIAFDKQASACTQVIGDADNTTETMAALYSARGTAYYRMKNWDLAFADYSRAIRLDPENAAYAYYNRAYVLLYRYQLRPALRDLTAVIQSHPDVSEPYALRAWVYEHLDDDVHAAEDRAKSNALRAAHPDVAKVGSTTS